MSKIELEEFAKNSKASNSLERSLWYSITIVLCGLRSCGEGGKFGSFGGKEKSPAAELLA